MNKVFKLKLFTDIHCVGVTVKVIILIPLRVGLATHLSICTTSGHVSEVMLGWVLGGSPPSPVSNLWHY